jgi:serine/threonine protein phosphatase 1
LPNRINLDTGAFATGRLTCLVLERDARLFIFAS